MRTLAQRRGFWIGAEVEEVEYLDDSRYCELLAREFNMLTPGNAMKFAPLRPDRYRYDFANADAIVSFAQARAMQVRGHALVWHRRNPDWLVKGNFSRDETLDILREHIFTVAIHFRGRVYAWDVINEAINDDGTPMPSFWLETIGPEYVDMAFHWAHEADPHARLFYNEWSAEGLNRKSDKVYALIQRLRERGVPIHGMGFQMHTSLAVTDMIGQFPDPREIETNLRRFAELGLEIHITEMDVQISAVGGSQEQRLAAQAQVYRDVLSICLAIPSFKALVVWGVTDRYSWIPKVTGRPDAPLLFDKAYQPKPAYCALKELLMDA